MYLKQRGCRQAFQRPGSIHYDALWISDDILKTTFERFCAFPRTAKRHGSFVPGVMHARSRLGRRRIAHMLQPESRPPQTAIGILLGLWEDLRGITRQWDYEVAPRPWQPPRKPRQHPISIPVVGEAEPPNEAAKVDEMPQLRDEQYHTLKPNGLEHQDDFVAVPARRAEVISQQEVKLALPLSIAKESHYVPRLPGQRIFTQTIPRFREAMRNADSSDARVLIARLTRTVYVTLANGSVAPKELVPALEVITEALETASMLENVQKNVHCRALYLAVWTGITACKAVRPLELPHETLKKFFRLTCRIPMNSVVQQRMAHDVVKSILLHDRDMLQEMRLLVEQWTASWYNHVPIEASEGLLSSIGHAVLLSEQALLQAHAHTMSLEEGLVCAKTRKSTYEAIDTVKSCLSQHSDDLIDMDYLARPLRRSAEDLAETLSLLHPNTAWQILERCVKSSLRRKIQGNEQEEMMLRAQGRYCWLVTTAAMKNIGDAAFFKLWKHFKHYPPRKASTDLRRYNFLDHYAVCSLLLRQWLSQGILKPPENLRLHFCSSVHKHSPAEDIYLALISAVKSQNGNVPLHIYRLVDNLIRLKMYGLTKSLWRPTDQLLQVAAELQTHHVYHMINRLSSWSTSHALKLFLRHRAVGPDHTVSIALLTPFYKTLIHDPSIRTHQIWACLHPPRRRKETNMSWPIQDDAVNSEHRHHLIGNIAMEFACCTQRVENVIFKNLVMCIAHLRYHGLKPSLIVTRAINKHFIQRGIETGQWMQTERLKWAIEMIAESEGEEVADEMVEIVISWRKHLMRLSIEKKHDSTRRQNVLMVRPGF